LLVARASSVRERFKQVTQFILDCFGGVDGPGNLRFDEVAKASSQSVNGHLNSTF
jgi:hypothetical protein